MVWRLKSHHIGVKLIEGIKHEIRSTKHETSTNNQSTKFKKMF